MAQVVSMSKAELIRGLKSLTREELDEIADEIDQLRGGDLTERERSLVRDRVKAYRANPDDTVDLDDAVAEILGKR